MAPKWALSWSKIVHFLEIFYPAWPSVTAQSTFLRILEISQVPLPSKRFAQKTALYQGGKKSWEAFTDFDGKFCENFEWKESSKQLQIRASAEHCALVHLPRAKSLLWPLKLPQISKSSCFASAPLWATYYMGCANWLHTRVGPISQIPFKLFLLLKNGH